MCPHRKQVILTLLLPITPPSKPSGPKSMPPTAAPPRPKPFLLAVTCDERQRGQRSGASGSLTCATGGTAVRGSGGGSGGGLDGGAANRTSLEQCGQVMAVPIPSAGNSMPPPQAVHDIFRNDSIVVRERRLTTPSSATGMAGAARAWRVERRRWREHGP